jgi:peptide/nickel transport system ATP-binding protein
MHKLEYWTPMETTENNYTLNITDLHVYFNIINGQVRAVNGLNMYVRYGESVGVGGETGCGKSVAMKAVMGLLPPESQIPQGEILYQHKDGRIVDVAKLNRQSNEMLEIRRKGMSMIFQEPSASLSPLHTVYQQMQEAIAGREKMDRKQRTAECVRLLALVGISQPERWVKEYPFRLSGGMAQRVMIAQAIAKNPNLLFADEPTTALDVTVQAQVLNLLNRLRKELNISMVFITHNMGIMAHMTERIYIIYLGKVVETAKTADLFNHPQHPYTKGLISCVPTLGLSKDTRLYNIPGMVLPNDAYIKGCNYYHRCDKFMPGLCDVVSPMEVDLGAEHKVSCHLFSQEGKGK